MNSDSGIEITPNSGNEQDTLTGVELIALERNRQIEVERYTVDHDKSAHKLGQLAGAAACYALKACGFSNPHILEAMRPPVTHKVRIWPFSDYWWKPSSKIRDLVKAGALIAAEIDRLQAIAPTQIDQPAMDAEPPRQLTKGESL